jgi:pyrimidine operon attenuation protein/uracil phosphoribosyltransferase
MVKRQISKIQTYLHQFPKESKQINVKSIATRGDTLLLTILMNLHNLHNLHNSTTEFEHI